MQAFSEQDKVTIKLIIVFFFSQSTISSTSEDLLEQNFYSLFSLSTELSAVPRETSYLFSFSTINILNLCVSCILHCYLNEQWKTLHVQYFP